MGDLDVSEEFDVADLFPAPARRRTRRSFTTAVPWYPLGHLVTAVLTAAVTWFGLSFGAPDAPAAVQVAATTVAAVVSLVLWARFGPPAAAVAVVVAGLLSAGAGALALYAPLAVALVAVTVVALRALGSRGEVDR